MAIIVSDNKKVYEKPPAGIYLGVVADVVDLGVVVTRNGPKMKLRIVWVLGKPDGSGYALDSEGNPFQVIAVTTASVHEKSTLFKIIKEILGTAPPSVYNVEELIGRSNELFVVHTKSEDGTKEYANIVGFQPLNGRPALAVPANFVRRKDQKQGQGAPGATRATQAAPFTAAQQTIQQTQPVTAPDVVFEKNEGF